MKRSAIAAVTLAAVLAACVPLPPAEKPQAPVSPLHVFPVSWRKMNPLNQV